LVVRNAHPFERWARGEHTLKLIVGVTPAESNSAIRMTAELARLGPCDVTAVHCYWPPTEWRRLGLTGVRDIQKEDPDVRRALERELSHCCEILRGAHRFELLTEPNLGSIGERLVRLASERGADLLIVGSRSHGMLQRLWEGSVSRTVLSGARASVACVPETRESKGHETKRQSRSILVATDFSKAGNEAVRLAYTGVERGGTIHLTHVSGRSIVDPLAPHDIFAGGPDRDTVMALLSALVPAEAAEYGVTTRIHALSSDGAAEAICQAAERLDVDAIYLGTPAHGGVAGVLLGSVASSVVAKTRRRVVLVRAPLE
jgi:nucleotide-binding universal stress UspA family protein